MDRRAQNALNQTLRRNGPEASSEIRISADDYRREYSNGFGKSTLFDVIKPLIDANSLSARHSASREDCLTIFNEFVEGEETHVTVEHHG